MRKLSVHQRVGEETRRRCKSFLGRDGEDKGSVEIVHILEAVGPGECDAVVHHGEDEPGADVQRAEHEDLRGEGD